MYTRHAIACVVAIGLTSAAFAASVPRVEFRDNRLKVDGKPFFMYGCWGTPGKDYTEFKRRHLNTAFLGWRSSVAEGPKAAAAGLMVIPYPYAPSWNQKMKQAMASLVDKDWVLAWNIGDDLSKKEHVAAALNVQQELRAMDPQRRPVMFDAIGLYDEFAKIPDMWCAYAYPLVKPSLSALTGGKPGGLSHYGEWLRAKRLLGRPDCFFWTWAQCHVQIWYSMQYLNGTAKDQWRPSRFPDGDHLRLIAGHAVSAGARGLMWFVHYYFQDDHFGRDRYARAAIIGCEFDVVGPLIAQGRAGERLRTSDPSVWATPIDFPGGRLICLLKTGEHYHYQPDRAEAKKVRVEVGTPGAVYQIGEEFKTLAEPQCSFELTSWLLVTEDRSLAVRVRAKHEQVLPDMARFAAEELEARLAKVEPILDATGRERESVGRARQCLDRAREGLARQRWPQALRAAEDGLGTVRAAQHRAWRETWSDEALGCGLKMADFYLLPRLAKQVARIKSGAWGPDQLYNGSFESDDGWGGAKLGHDTKGKAGLIPQAGRKGSRALRLASDSPTIYQGKPRDWVTVDVVSKRIPANPGDLLELVAWVRVPKPLEQTERGVTIALYAYTSEGKRIPGYGAQQLEATQVKATAGWGRMRLLVHLSSPNAAGVAVRLSICGVGEAYLDDVTVRRLARE